MDSIKNIVEKITHGISNDRDKAIAIHDYVRDSVNFGFNRYFDKSELIQTLDKKIGHCIPKGRLMVAFLQAADIEANLHFVVLPKEILKGAVTDIAYRLMPKNLSHCYTEVKIDKYWWGIDSYIIDKSLFKASQKKLVNNNIGMGFATHKHATISWDGKSDAFCQFNTGFSTQDHGIIKDIDSYFNSNKYQHKLYGINLNLIYGLIGKRLETRSKIHLDNLRNYLI